MSDLSNGVLFSPELMKGVKDRFYYVDHGPDIGERLFFDNAGGSFFQFERRCQGFTVTLQFG